MSGIWMLRISKQGSERDRIHSASIHSKQNNLPTKQKGVQCIRYQDVHPLRMAEEGKTFHTMSDWICSSGNWGCSTGCLAGRRLWRVCVGRHQGKCRGSSCGGWGKLCWIPGRCSLTASGECETYYTPGAMPFLLRMGIQGISNIPAE